MLIFKSVIVLTFSSRGWKANFYQLTSSWQIGSIGFNSFEVVFEIVAWKLWFSLKSGTERHETNYQHNLVQDNLAIVMCKPFETVQTQQWFVQHKKKFDSKASVLIDYVGAALGFYQPDEGDIKINTLEVFGFPSQIILGLILQ